MEPTVLQFYYRSGCHLCDDMWQQLQQERLEYPFELDAIDVDGTEALKERLGLLIPVLEGDGEEICRYYLDPVALKNYLIKTGTL